MQEPIIKKRVAVVGSRTFNDKHKLYEVLTKNFDRIKLVVSGGAKGADTIATEWATDFGIPYLVFPALWRDPFTGVYSKGAGFKRNRQIVDQADVVIAFWDGESAGTANTIEMAKQCKKDVRIIRFTLPPPPAEPPTDNVHGPHCCTAEAMQAKHDFHEAVDVQWAESPPETSETPKIPFKDDIL